MKLSITSAYLSLLFIATASGAVEPTQVREALAKKTETYLKEGMISGGDREVHAGIVKDVRRAMNGGFERIVVDIDAEKVPYYQVAIDSARRQILVTVFGSPKLALNAKKIVEQFRKSPLVSRVDFYPVVEEDSWTFALTLRAAVPVEVFELTAPTRIIFDLKGGAGMLGELQPKEKSAPVRSVKKSIARAPVAAKKPAAKPKPIRANLVEDEYEGNSAAVHSEDLPE